MYFLKFLFHLGMWDLVALGADLFVERYHHFLLDQPNKLSFEFFCYLIFWSKLLLPYSKSSVFVSGKEWFFSISKMEFTKTRGLKTICNLRIMSSKKLLNAYLLFWSRGPCFRIISRKVGIRFGLGGNVASNPDVLVFNIIIVICANKRLLGSFHHIWKSLFMFTPHQHQGTKSEPWIELNIWGEDIMSGNSLSRHIPEQLRNIEAYFFVIIANDLSCVKTYWWMHFTFWIVVVICNENLATLTG